MLARVAIFPLVLAVAIYTSVNGHVMDADRHESMSESPPCGGAGEELDEE
jgi:hypothetical protein